MCSLPQSAGTSGKVNYNIHQAQRVSRIAIEAM